MVFDDDDRNPFEFIVFVMVIPLKITGSYWLREARRNHNPYEFIGFFMTMIRMPVDL